MKQIKYLSKSPQTCFIILLKNLKLSMNSNQSNSKPSKSQFYDFESYIICQIFEMEIREEGSGDWGPWRIPSVHSTKRRSNQLKMKMLLRGGNHFLLGSLKTDFVVPFEWCTSLSFFCHVTSFSTRCIPPQYSNLWILLLL